MDFKNSSLVSAGDRAERKEGIKGLLPQAVSKQNRKYWGDPPKAGKCQGSRFGMYWPYSPFRKQFISVLKKLTINCPSGHSTVD